MDVNIKKFDVKMAVKTKGFEMDVYRPNGGEFLGDCIVTKTGLIVSDKPRPFRGCSSRA